MPQQSHIISAFGLITRSDISAVLEPSREQGIYFQLANGPLIKADVSSVSSTQRNTVLEAEGRALCLVEHFMAACALSGVSSMKASLSADELPFADGSAQFWMEPLKEFGLRPSVSSRKLSREIYIEDPSNPQRNIRAIPSEDNFAVTYVLDMRHIACPVGLMTYSWQLGSSLSELAAARTFSSEAENIILGLSGRVVGYSEAGYSMPLRDPLEPAQHKVLDLIGDMYLSGINPLDIKMQVISNQGGHSLNVELARQLLLCIA